jgi:hypothetical protein
VEFVDTKQESMKAPDPTAVPGAAAAAVVFVLHEW